MKTSTRIPAYKMAALEIRKFIEKNGLTVGDPLPPEAALAQQLGISRPSLREGVKALESVGVLEARHGEGVFVTNFSFDSIVENLPYSMLADNAQLTQLLEVRTALEVGMIPKIVAIIPQTDIDALRALALRMKELADGGKSFAEEDRQFHAQLFACLANPFLNRLVDLFWKVFQKMAHTLPMKPPSSGQHTAQEHLEIVERLADGDISALKSAHERHFKEIRKRIVLPSGNIPAGPQINS
jgi:DNA-binding FadR family transcriptional regulator